MTNCHIRPHQTPVPHWTVQENMGPQDHMTCKHRRIADEYFGGAAVTKFPTKYFRIELCVESLLCE